jgi:hypothetical protein
VFLLALGRRKRVLRWWQKKPAHRQLKIDWSLNATLIYCLLPRVVFCSYGINYFFKQRSYVHDMHEGLLQWTLLEKDLLPLFDV